MCGLLFGICEAVHGSTVMQSSTPDNQQQQRYIPQIQATQISVNTPTTNGQQLCLPCIVQVVVEVVREYVLLKVCNPWRSTS